jgi:hypothetical protein
VDRDDFRLHPQLFRILEQRYGLHDVDLFATNVNTQLPRFFSRFFCPGTPGVNSFLQSWSGVNAYANPPFDPDVLLNVVQKVREDQASVTLVVPYWIAQPWWPLLMDMAVDMVFLPSNTSLFAPGMGGSSRFLPPPQWQVVAVRVEF